MCALRGDRLSGRHNALLVRRGHGLVAVEGPSKLGCAAPRCLSWARLSLKAAVCLPSKLSALDHHLCLLPQPLAHFVALCRMRGRGANSCLSIGRRAVCFQEIKITRAGLGETLMEDQQKIAHAHGHFNAERMSTTCRSSLVVVCARRHCHYDNLLDSEIVFCLVQLKARRASWT